MNISDVILNLDLKIGEQHRGDCPACAGHNTFTVTRTLEGTLFNCYKAGCRLAGRRTTSIRVNDLQVAENQEDIGPFSLPPHVVIGRSEITEWINKHDYPFANVELYYDLLDNRIVFPVRHDGGKKTLQFTQELRGQLSHNRIFAARLEDDLKYRRKRDMVLIKEKIGELIEQK
jgi:hypothetical protein